jgi:hypothetical protein
MIFYIDTMRCSSSYAMCPHFGTLRDLITADRMSDLYTAYWSFIGMQ